MKGAGLGVKRDVYFCHVLPLLIFPFETCNMAPIYLHETFVDCRIALHSLFLCECLIASTNCSLTDLFQTYFFLH